MIASAKHAGRGRLSKSGRHPARKRGNQGNRPRPTILRSMLGAGRSNWTNWICARALCASSHTGSEWTWVHYPTRYNRYFEGRRAEEGWETESPKLVLSKLGAAIHFLQTKTITAKKIIESKRDPDLVTVAVDLNVKYLAVITVRQHGQIIQTRFVSDQGLDQHRYRHLEQVAKKQWQSGKAVKGERSNQQLWAHVRRQNQDSAHDCRARAIVEVGTQYPGCVCLRALTQDQTIGRKQIEEAKSQTRQSTQRQNQSTRERKSLCSRSGNHRG